MFTSISNAVIVTMTLSPFHMFLQYLEDLQPRLKSVFKYRGDVPNSITSAVFNTWLVCIAVNNLHKATVNNELYVLSQYSIDTLYYMIGYFTYDLVFMIQSSSRKYYIEFIIHHVIAMAMIIFTIIIDRANNLSSNTIIIILESPTPLLNLSKISGYISQNAPVTKSIQKIIPCSSFTISKGKRIITSLLITKI
jgi:hypothetical protein